MLLNLNPILLTLVAVVMRHVEPGRENRKICSGTDHNITLTEKKKMLSSAFRHTNSFGCSFSHSCKKKKVSITVICNTDLFRAGFSHF